jgi:hypothetical protein
VYSHLILSPKYYIAAQQMEKVWSSLMNSSSKLVFLHSTTYGVACCHLLLCESFIVFCLRQYLCNNYTLLWHWNFVMLQICSYVWQIVPGHMYNEHLVLALKLGVTNCRPTLTIGWQNEQRDNASLRHLEGPSDLKWMGHGATHMHVVFDQRCPDGIWGMTSRTRPIR